MGALAPENKTEAEWKQMREWHQQGDEQILAIWKQMNALKYSYEEMNFTLHIYSRLPPAL